jgi:methyltransferase-like protein 6
MSVRVYAFSPCCAPVCSEVDGPVVLLEAGCGNGANLFALLRGEPRFHAFAADFSASALESVPKHCDHALVADRITPVLCDLSTGELPAAVPDASVHVAFCVFVLSAIHPSRHVPAIAAFKRVLAPGGRLCFRDYGVFDMAHVRFGPSHQVNGSNRLYRRGDGTLSYFFSTGWLCVCVCSMCVCVCVCVWVCVRPSLPCLRTSVAHQSRNVVCRRCSRPV